jgi:hypothetical protein
VHCRRSRGASAGIRPRRLFRLHRQDTKGAKNPEGVSSVFCCFIRMPWCEIRVSSRRISDGDARTKGSFGVLGVFVLNTRYRSRFSVLFGTGNGNGGSGGGSGIRTHGGVNLTGFQDRRLRPLGHPSGTVYFTVIRLPRTIPLPVRRGAGVVEQGCLLSSCPGQPGPRVRIPPSPP